MPPHSHTTRAVDSIEQGLRDLAKGTGPSIFAITSPWSAGLARLREIAEAFYPRSAPEDRAQMLLELIHEEIIQLQSGGERLHPKCSAALQAAFRMPQFDYGDKDGSIRQRLEVARLAGAFDTARARRGTTAGADAGKINWNRGVTRLAQALKRRLAERERSGWDRADLPSSYQPVSFDRILITHYCSARTVTESVYERWMTAEEDGLSRYMVRAWSLIEKSGRPLIEVQPLLNCSKGDVQHVDLGNHAEAQLVEILLPTTLQRGEKVFFATKVVSQEPDRTTMREVQVTNHGIGELIMRVQFDLSVPAPKQLWHFGEVADLDGLIPPPEGDPRNLVISPYGFVSWNFDRGLATAKYGLAWRW